MRIDIQKSAATICISIALSFLSLTMPAGAYDLPTIGELIAKDYELKAIISADITGNWYWLQKGSSAYYCYGHAQTTTIGAVGAIIANFPCSPISPPK